MPAPPSPRFAPPVLACLASTVAVAFLSSCGGGSTRADRQGDPPRVLFLVNEDPSNYEAYRTIPAFAESLSREGFCAAEVIHGEGELNALRFPGLEDALADCDLLVVYFRRVALPRSQMEAVQEYLAAGKPIVGLRTANHAFSVRDDGAAEGHEDWWAFVPDILGHENQGYGRHELGTSVSPGPAAPGHPVLDGVEPLSWQGAGGLYLVEPLLDDAAEVLLLGESDGESHAVAWTRRSPGGGRVFYTSLGYPDDFDLPQFRALLRNGLEWALGQR